MAMDAEADDAQVLVDSAEETAARENREKMMLKLKGQISNDGVFRRREEADERAVGELEDQLNAEQKPQQLEQPLNNNYQNADPGQVLEG